MKVWQFALLIGVAIVWPFVATAYATHVSILVLLNVTYSVALYSVFRMGYLSLGHAAFIALGAYGCVILSVKFGLSPWLGIPFGALVAGVFASGLGLLTLGLRGIYFSMAIFAFGEIVTAFFRAFDWFGGPAGIPGVPRPEFFGLPLATHFSFYWLVLGVALLGTGLLYRLQFTRFGATLLTLKSADTERLAESVGIATARYKNAAFVVACMVTGAAGGVHAQYFLYINPQVFTFLTSTDLLIYVMVGGVGSFWGPVLGAAVLTIAGEQLYSVGYWKTLIYALILMTVIMVLPGGLVDLPRRLQAWRLGAASRRAGLEPK
jgi:branched-chain amino acid transport system permease protein